MVLWTLSAEKMVGFGWLVIFIISFWAGSSRMIRLINDPDIDIAKSNFRLGFWACVFGVVAIYTTGWIGIITSYLTGLFFGLIGVNYIFEKEKLK